MLLPPEKEPSQQSLRLRKGGRPPEKEASQQSLLRKGGPPPGEGHDSNPPPPDNNGLPPPTDKPAKGVEDDQKKDPPKASIPPGTVSNSERVMIAFKPIRILSLVLGRFPFQPFRSKVSGLYGYRFKKLSIPSISFHITSAIFFFVFWIFAISYTAFYFGYNESKVKNRCQETWESSILLKTAVPTIITGLWLYLLFWNSVLIMFKGKNYLQYMNYWSRAVTVLDVDPTKGIYKRGVWTACFYGTYVLIYFVCFFSKFVPIIDDGVAAILNGVVRLYKQDIGVDEKFNENFTEKVINAGVLCKDRRPIGKVLLSTDYDTALYYGIKVLAAFCQAYALFGSDALILQFRSYCRMLKNTCTVWNERLLNLFHRVDEDDTDQTKRRLRMKLLMKDHLVIVQLFDYTEAIFSSILQSYYLVQIVSLCAELYFLSAMKTSSTCEKLFTAFNDIPEVMKACLGFDKDYNIKGAITPTKGAESPYKFFIDPCYPEGSILLQTNLVAITLTVQTVIQTFRTTSVASAAYEESVRGFNILRQHGYMTTEHRRDRNFVHSMLISFASNNPMQITAGNYFVVRKPLLVAIGFSILTYYVILLQFRPGEFDSRNLCERKVCEGGTQKYPGYNISHECKNIH